MNEVVRAAFQAMRANARVALEYAAAHPDWRGDRLVVDAIAWPTTTATSISRSSGRS